MLIPGKTLRPQLTSDNITRNRLINQLEHHRTSIVLLQASAGYGKSNLVSQWLHSRASVGWLTLDELDNDTWRFMRYLTKAINDATNNAANQTAVQLQQNRDLPLLTAVSMLMDQLGTWGANQRKPCYLVLDDYHLIDNPQIDKAIKLLLLHLPDALRLVIMSRTIPNLGIANLRAKQQIFELNSDDLAFSRIELTQFMSVHLSKPLDKSTTDALLSYTKGWPSAAQLLVLQANHQFNTISQITQEHSSFQPIFVWDYLAEEVFSNQSDDVQQFLLRSSILDCFDSHLAKIVTQQDDPSATIEYLTRVGLFITPLGQGRHQYHPLFQQFLSNQRERLPASEKTRLHQLAVQAWLAADNPAKALEHARETDNPDLISQLVLSYGWTLFNRGELNQLNHALELLTHEQITYNPQLGLLKAWLLQMQFRYQDVETLIETILTNQNHLPQDAQPAPLSNQLRGEFNALLAQVAINKGDHQRATQLAESALLILDHASYRARLIATSVLGEVHHVQGSLNQALSLMQQTERYARQHQFNHQVLWALIQQIEIYIALGNTQTAYDLQTRAFEFVSKHAMQHLPLYDFLIRLRAQLLCDWLRLDEAELIITQRLTELDSISEHSHLPAILSRIAFLKGNNAKAIQLASADSVVIARINSHLDWVAEVSFSQLLIWQTQNNRAMINQWLTHTTLPSSLTNHFTQQQGRNYVRAYLGLNQIDLANNLLVQLRNEASEHSLTSELFKNQLLSTYVARLNQQTAEAEQYLYDALQLSLTTSYLAEFILYAETIYPLLLSIKSRGTHSPLMQHRIQQLIQQLKPNQAQAEQLSPELIAQLTEHKALPEVLRSSPLTEREWQVLSMIYSGMNNEQIAYQIDVAPTTVKTHIRNLYQKMNIPNRKAAKAFARELIELVYSE